MKTLILIFIFFGKVTEVNAQTVREFQYAITNPQKAVQAIHQYPENIENGKCHWVEITSIQLFGDSIRIVETWTSAYNKDKVKTILTGKILDGMADGKWKSDYSSGMWSYNFNTSKGKWNKTESILGTFKDWKTLQFNVVNNIELKDGFYNCP